MSGVNRDSSSRITRRHFLVGAGAAAAGLALYSGEISRHELDLVPRTLVLSNLPSAFNGFRIAQISDIHLEEFTEPFFLERVVRHVNALAADMVLLTGDFVTHGSLTFMNGRSAAHRCAEILSTLTCPLRFACLGNHDVAVSAPLVIHALTSNGIPVLVDQHVPIERNGSRFWLAGVNDPGTTNPRLELAVPLQPDGPVILMAHEPDYADTVRQHPRGKLVDVMLSGHTHGGQIRLPFLGPLVLPPMGRIYPEGLFRLGDMQLYVNRGIGSVGIPFRLNCPPEITIFTLQSA
ncbi:MAG: metallophosphoesterase [Edaphobacter sp.]